MWLGCWKDTSTRAMTGRWYESRSAAGATIDNCILICEAHGNIHACFLDFLVYTQNTLSSSLPPSLPLYIPPRSVYPSLPPSPYHPLLPFLYISLPHFLNFHPYIPPSLVPSIPHSLSISISIVVSFALIAILPMFLVYTMKYFSMYLLDRISLRRSAIPQTVLLW